MIEPNKRHQRLYWRLLVGVLGLLIWGSSLHAATPRIVTLFQGATDSALALGVVPVGSVVAWEHPPLYPYWARQIDALTA